jgi:hypothetical protein
VPNQNVDGAKSDEGREKPHSIAVIAEKLSSVCRIWRSESCSKIYHLISN